MRPIRNHRRRRRGRRANRHRTSSFSLTLNRFQAFAIFVAYWLKHTVRGWLRGHEREDPNSSRERIYVDASYTNEEQAAETGTCGIGVWLPRRGIALSLKLKAATSMEAEILALLAGTIAAKRFDVQRPIIFSDCKSAVGMGTKILQAGRTGDWKSQLVAFAEMSGAHAAYGRIYDQLLSLGGSLAWRPREDNREADIASSIGSRIGHMGIRLSRAKNRNHALNDVLSLADTVGKELEEAQTTGVRGGVVRQSLRCGTRTVGLTSRGAASGRAFARQASRLISRLKAEVA